MPSGSFGRRSVTCAVGGEASSWKGRGVLDVNCINIPGIVGQSMLCDYITPLTTHQTLDQQQPPCPKKLGATVI